MTNTALQPPKNQIEYLEILEAGTLMSSKNRVGEQGLALITFASGCYGALTTSCLQAANDLQLTGQELSKEQAMLMQSAISCKRHLLNGFISLLRGQSSDSFDNLRKALEYTLFLAHAFEAPGAAEKWLRAADSENDYANYRDEFKIMKMLNPSKYLVLTAELPIIKHLIEKYEKACLWVHATVISGGPVREDRDGAAGFAFLDAYVDIDSTKLEMQYLWALEAHSFVLQLHQILLRRTGLSVNEITWTNTMNLINFSIMGNAQNLRISEIKRALPRDAIAERAYMRYLHRNRMPGRDLEDWFGAETELIAENLHQVTAASHAGS